jgi:hypothetical protein
MNATPPAARRRAYVFPGRHKCLFVRYTDAEYAEVTAAAVRYGPTPGARVLRYLLRAISISADASA